MGSLLSEWPSALTCVWRTGRRAPPRILASPARPPASHHRTESDLIQSNSALLDISLYPFELLTLYLWPLVLLLLASSFKIDEVRRASMGPNQLGRQIVDGQQATKRARPPAHAKVEVVFFVNKTSRIDDNVCCCCC